MQHLSSRSRVQRPEQSFGWRLDLFDVDLRTNVPSTDLEELSFFEPYRDGTRINLWLPDGTRQGFTVEPKQLSGFAGLFLGDALVTMDFMPDPGVTSTLKLSQDFTLVLTDTGEFMSPDGFSAFNPASPLLASPPTYILTTFRSGSLKVLTTTPGRLRLLRVT